MHTWRFTHGFTFNNCGESRSPCGAHLQGADVGSKAQLNLLDGEHGVIRAEPDVRGADHVYSRPEAGPVHTRYHLGHAANHAANHT